MMKHKIILSATDLSIGYPSARKGPKTVLKGLNLRVMSGEVLCVLGPNGSGKSTLLRTLAGIQHSLTGQVKIEGHIVAVQAHNKLARLLSVVLTERVEVRNLTVSELVSMGRYPYNNWMGQVTASDQDIIDRAISQVKLETLKDRNIQELSDGEQQRVMIAKALAQDTELIILDEPTAHLDLPNRIEIMQLLRRLARETGKAFLLSSHDLELSLQAADRFWLIPVGGPLLAGTAMELVNNGDFRIAFSEDYVAYDETTNSFKMHYNI